MNHLLPLRAAVARFVRDSALAVFLLSGSLIGCVPANVLDDGPLADRVVNDRWVHPKGLFSFRVTAYGWRPGLVAESVDKVGGSLNAQMEWREALVLLWGDRAHITDGTILSRIQVRSPGAEWTLQGTVDLEGVPARYRAAWMPKPGANKGVSSAFGFSSLDAFALFVRFERAGIPFLMGVEVRVHQSFDDKRRKLAFDHVATFEAELKKHLEHLELATAAISTEDPALDWFRD